MEMVQQIFFSTLAFSFAILHFILFFYHPRVKSNLYFAIFLILYAMNIFFDFQSFMAPDWETKLLYLRLHRAVMPYNSVFALLFSYSLFRFSIPRQFWMLLVCLIITGALAVYKPLEYFNYMQFFLFGVMIEAFRIYSLAVKRKKQGAWIVAFGFSFLVVFSIYDLLLDLKILDPVFGIVNGYPFGFVFLILAVSVFLTREFAHLNLKMVAQEKERQQTELRQRLLEAEDLRKSRELEQARELQLSMLRQCSSRMDEIEVCFDMSTANEVGGDYYDYVRKDDGSLTLAIGDATGHGIKAGVMVAIVKSLFISHAPNMSYPEFFNHCSHILRQMQLGRLYMSLLLVSVKDGLMTTSAAGMPPILVYRSCENTIQEYVTKGMPLGAVDHFPYQTLEIRLELGDTVLLFSDGLMELFDENNEIFDLHRIKSNLLRAGKGTCKQIVQQMLSAASEWQGQRKQQDDITLVAFRYLGRQ